MYEIKKPKIGDKVLVRTRMDGNKICVIDRMDDKKIHFNNKSFGLEVNAERVHALSEPFRGATFIYESFN
jgi:hypothetical protein